MVICRIGGEGLSGESIVNASQGIQTREREDSGDSLTRSWHPGKQPLECAGSISPWHRPLLPRLRTKIHYRGDVDASWRLAHGAASSQSLVRYKRGTASGGKEEVKLWIEYQIL